MRRSSSLGLLASLAAALTACSLLTSLDGFTGPDAAGADASTSTTSDGEPADTSSDRADAPLVDAGDDAAPNIHPQGTFEGSACDPWDGFQAGVAISSTARTGNGSCRVCTRAGVAGDFATDDEDATGAATVGGTYRARAWVRAAPSAPIPGPVFMNFRTRTPGMVQETSISKDVTVTTTWQLLTTTLAVTKPGTLDLVIGPATAPADACFLLDDVTIQRVE